MEELKQKVKERDEMEITIKNLIAELEMTPVGLHGSVVDSEGYPRNDVDIPVIRSKRQQLSRLQNDYKALMEVIEADLHKLHSETKQNQKPAKKEEQEETKKKEHFAVIKIVSHDSPSYHSGLRVGDRVTRFGNIQSKANFKDLGSFVASHENKPIQVDIIRKESNGEDVNINISLTPVKWSGQGLLGCFIEPV
eukprot:c13038_g1_i1.p1 GENE.c13038_g1_i1~~c13038_g1_i1.p1  ORF type:complete len:201 (-),score=83.86 c13038_g1_i1:12-593(-)